MDMCRKAVPKAWFGSSECGASTPQSVVHRLHRVIESHSVSHDVSGLCSSCYEISTGHRTVSETADSLVGFPLTPSYTMRFDHSI